MIKPIVKDVFFLGQKSDLATKQDLSVGQDLQDTLVANQNRCVGMADSLMDDISLFKEENTEAEIIDEEREIR